MPEIVGVTFPIPKPYIQRFLNDGKTMFLKPSGLKHLREGMRFVFYQSRKDTGYVGEATIKQISVSENPISFFKIYGDDIFLTKAELEVYIEGIKKWKTSNKKNKYKPRNSRWIAIKLESIHPYDMPKKPNRFIPIGGQYIRDENHI